MSQTSQNVTINRLDAKVLKIEAEILRLSRERTSLKKEIYKLRISAINETDSVVTQKNSTRLYVWSVVKGILSVENKPVQTKTLYNKVKDITKEDISYGTFRSYLNNYKIDKKIYKKIGQSGWSLS